MSNVNTRKRKRIGTARVGEGDGDEEVTTKVRRYKKMIRRGGGGKGEQLAQQVYQKDRGDEQTGTKHRRGHRRWGGSRTRGEDGKKRRTHVAIEASRHSERTLATWHRMLREGIT
eukprot:scaffold5498_cov102-Isochrysis_galbana.AAC.7